MRTRFGTFLAVAAVAVALLGSGEALAGTHGVVFIHGSGDYSGTPSCTGSGSSAKCVVASALSGYWNQGYIDSVRNGRAYAIVGFNGGSCAPWPSGTTTLAQGSSTYTSIGGCSTGGNGDVIAAQIKQFITYAGITDLVMVTHSGGSNLARFILQNYTRNSNYTAVKNVTKRVVTVAAPTLGTYLANEIFANAVTSFLGGLLGFKGDGTNFIRTNYISTYNGASSYFAGINNPVSGVNFYSTGGISGKTCNGVTLFGACVGVTTQTLGGIVGACDSATDDAALLVLHQLYLNTSDSATARDGVSDGFISTMSSWRLGNKFNYNQKQDHNQSRRQCNGLDVAIRSTVTAAEAGFVNSEWPAEEVPVTKVDACGFAEYASIKNSGGVVQGWTAGCSPSDLGDGWCDWDCVAMYGHDAPATWAGTPGSSVVTAWGATDDCANSSYTTTNTVNASNTCTTAADCPADTYASANGYNTNYQVACVSGTCRYTYVDNTNNPWADYGVYTSDFANYHTTQFNGKSLNGSSTAYFTDPLFGQVNSAAYCPASWIGDGTCDECVLAQYGSDGLDCLPGHISQCGGLLTQSQPWASTNNPIYNAGDPATNGTTWLFWSPVTATSGNGICENTECGLGTAGADTMQTVFPCTSGSQCPGMLGCNTGTGLCTLCTNNTNNASGSCNSTTYGWSGGTCNTNTGICYYTNTLGAQCNSNTDCLTGTCQNGGCTTSAADCTASFTVVSTTAACATTADCNGAGNCVSGVCGGCSTTADCNGLGTCVNSVCTSSVAGSLCR